ncbi:MAG: hypothetical protein ACYCS8_03975 [Acidithiobacillus sp.]
MSCFDEDQSAEITMSAADFAIMRDEVVRLEAENAALHAECDRLTAMLGPQKVLSAEEVTEPGLYFWREHEGAQWTVTDVEVNHAPELRQYYFGNEEDEVLNGQFIGPIKMPEVQ